MSRSSWVETWEDHQSVKCEQLLAQTLPFPEPVEGKKRSVNYFGYTATIGIFLPNPNAFEETRNVGGA